MSPLIPYYKLGTEVPSIKNLLIQILQYSCYNQPVMLDLNISIAGLAGVGPKIQEKMESVGLKTVKDLLFYFPRKWDDFRNFTPITWVRRDEEVTIKGTIIKVTKDRTRLRNMIIVKARIQDQTGEITAVWFNQGFIERMLKENLKVTLHGKVDYDWKNKERILASPVIVKEEKIVPVYSESSGIPSKIYEKIINSALSVVANLEEWLPEQIKEKYDLIDLSEAVKQIHHPSSFEALEAAKSRLAFDELFLIALSMAKIRSQMQKQNGFTMKIDEQLLKDFVADLPFKLTDAQRKVAWEIIKDLGKGIPMNRLVEGDVGSGKTIVGAMAALVVIKNGFQTAWMAPTEILAKQHYKNMSSLLEKYGIKTALVTGSVKEDHTVADMIIGTQALIQEKMQYRNLGLVIVDEQHRFGVKQRGALHNTQQGSHPELVSGSSLSSDSPTTNPQPPTTSQEMPPHFLSMTATPIPRTLALALYGDLDISIIDQMPEGRQVVQTEVIPPENRHQAYKFIASQINEGRQAFVICPLIDTKKKDLSEAALEFDLTQTELFETEKKSATQEYEKLSKDIFPDLNIGLLHGKMKNKEKEEIMNQFASGDINILVSTAVVEVGIDIQNATVMMIEGAERFGLAQLHQFRGRVGRGKHQSHCFLFPQSWSEPTKARLEALVDSHNGFELAEKDLQLRGPGELVGIKQSGLPDLKMASLTDTILIGKARNAAEIIIDKDLDNFPRLQKKLEEFQQTRHLE